MPCLIYERSRLDRDEICTIPVCRECVCRAGAAVAGHDNTHDALEGARGLQKQRRTSGESNVTCDHGYSVTYATGASLM